MTSRGNPSISPPAQIPQQRHVNAISSGTPPPQQFIPGQTPALQPSYELLQHQQTQGQPLLSYQAYGSALNDPRGQAGNSGRGGPPQQNLPQGGAYYPQQPLQNMMPQQSQQGPTTHQSYYISAQRPGGYRQRAPQPQPQSGQQMFYMTPTFPGNNVIMQYPPAARVPLYQPYATGNPPFQNMYFPNGGPAQWRGPTGMAPTATPNVRPPAAREKKPLTITDPESGRNILEEVVNRPRSTGGEEPVEETPADQSNQEIRKTFTRLVADRLKSPDESTLMAAPAENQGTVSGAPAGPTAAVASSQQYQQPPPQQQVQQQQQQQPSPLGPNTMMRPHMTGPPPMHIMPPRPGMMQQPPTSATPPQDMQLQGLNVNLSMPPPQIPMRQPTPVHIYPQQQQQQQHPAHHGPRHPQPPQQQPQQQAIRTAMPPNPMMVVPPQQPQTQPQSQPHPQPPIPAQVQPQAPPPSTAVEPATQTVKTEPSVMAKQKPQAEATPQDNIPAKSTGPAPASAPAPVTKTPCPPSKEESPALSAQPEPAAEVKPSAPVTSAPATTPKETPSITEEAPVAEKTEEPSKEETPQGASTQGVKDVRKGKNKKKDFNRKEIGGSDMDAFIDTKEKVWDDANSGAGEALRTRTNNAIENQSETSMGGTEAVDSSAEYSVPASDHAPAYVSNATANANASSSKEPETEESEWQAGDQPEAAAASDKDRKLNVPKSQDSVKPVASPVQVESKHKLKKKKKKKGRKTPPIQKAKQSASANESSETVTLTSGQPSKSAASEIYGVEDKENETVDADAKPPLPPTAGEAKNAQQEKPTGQEAKTTAAPTPVSQEPPKVTNKEPSPQPPAPAPTPSTAASAQVPKQEEKAPAAPREPEKSVQDTAPAVETPSTPSAPSKNQNQQATDQVGGSIRNNRRLPGQTERQSSQPLDNGIPEDARSDSVPSAPSDASSDATKVNHQAFNDENEPPKEAAPKQKVEESRKGQPATDSDDAPMKPPAEKVNKVKRDGKEKLQYDRNYLMELRECASSQTKPEGLPNLEIILDKPVTNRVTNAAPLDFTPAFFQPQSNQRHPAQIGKSGSRGRQRPDIQMAPRVIKSVSLQNDVKPLHQSEKPWQPKQKQATAGEIAEKKKTLEAEVLFIMNRLTPTNFERLAGEMRKLNIKTYEDLQELVKIFFDKVTMETKFVEAYANLCKVMCGLKVPPPPNSGMKENQATFRVVMLTKCQQEFEADKTIIFEDPEEKKKKIESEMPEGAERDEHIEKTLYQMKLRRLKFYGNIRFIGELFKLGMLTENIMHDCIFRLLKARDDDSLVSLCNLITTVGQNLDTDKAKGRMDQYFAQMGKIADERKSRIKFTLKDAIDLRSNNWVPRKEQTGPKKIDEVHKDFQQEQATKQFLQSQPLPPRQETPQPGSRRGSRQRQDDKPTDDGWNTVGSKSLRIDASKMKLSKNVVDENNIQLGPGGGMNKFSMWSRGSYGGAQPTQEPERPPTNRFSALRGEEERRTFQRSPNRGDSNVANRGMRQGPTAGHGRGKILARSSQEGERRDALASARSIVGGRSQNSSRDNSWNREDRRQPMGPRGSREGDNPMTRSDISLRPHMDTLLPPSAGPMPSGGATAGGYDDDQPVLKKLKPMSEEEMEHKAKTILEEYLNVRDLEEAKLCLMELEGQAHLHVLVTACINDVLEKTTKDRELTGQFFHEMVKSSLLSFDLYIKGLGEVLQYAEDMVIDIPMMWTYLAQMIVPLLLGGSLPWSKLLPTIKPHLEGRCGAKLVAEILLTTKSKTSEADVAQMWQSNGLQWTDLMDASEVDNFLKDKKLEFTVSPVSAAAASRVAAVDEVDLQKVTQDIEKMVRENAANDKIFDYIKRNVKVEKCEKNFVRALMTAIASSCISPSGSSTKKVVEDVVKVCKDILMKYIKNAELELQALYAIQALMHKLEHPSGVIVSLFDTLYDEEIISEDAFKQWEKSTDEQEGKGPCSMQLTQFFTWLRENEEPEASS